MRKLFFRKPRGATLLVLSSFTAIILSSLIFTFLARQTMNVKHAGIYAERDRAYFAAEAGVEQAIDWLRRNPATAGAWPLSGTPLDRSPVMVPVATDPWGGSTTIGNGTVTVSFWKHATTPDLYLIRAVGQVPSQMAPGGVIAQTVQSWILIANYARFAYLSNTLNPNFWFGTGNLFTGPVHMNGDYNPGPPEHGPLQIRGNPRFDAPVSTTASQIVYPGGTQPDGVTPVDTVSNNPQFNAGLPTLGASTQPYPAALPPAITSGAGITWDVDTTIHLETDGTMTVTNSVVGTGVNMPIPSNGIVYVKGSSAVVNVDGVLNGRLTIATDGDVVVTNHITYNPADDPVVGGVPRRDSLGLVAQGNVRVAQAAPNDLHLSAMVMSLTGGLVIDGLDAGTIGNKGTLYFYGSLLEFVSNRKRTFDSSGGTLAGYTGQYTYNPDAILNGPPAFPNGNPVELSRERL